MTVWVTWSGSKRAHAAVVGVTPQDVPRGSFPLQCGRWAPDGWDADVSVTSMSRRCKRCAAKEAS